MERAPAAGGRPRARRCAGRIGLAAAVRGGWRRVRPPPAQVAGLSDNSVRLFLSASLMGAFRFMLVGGIGLMNHLA